MGLNGGTASIELVRGDDGRCSVTLSDRDGERSARCSCGWRCVGPEVMDRIARHLDDAAGRSVASGSTWEA
jgi:hypothetical protein